MNQTYFPDDPYNEEPYGEEIWDDPEMYVSQRDDWTDSDEEERAVMQAAYDDEWIDMRRGG